MKKAKKIVMGFLALMPLLWLLLTVSTGIMGARSDISTYLFGTIHAKSGTTDVIEYTENSAAQAILEPFIPAGTNYNTDFNECQRALFSFANTISSVTFRGVGLMPNTYILIAVLYLFYLFVISLMSIVVDFITLPIRLVSGWLDDAR